MINVTKTTLPPLDKYVRFLQKMWKSNQITNDGELSILLKKELENYLQVKNLQLVTNGTIAMQLLYKVFNLSGEVITTPFTFPATTNSLLWEGLKPVFADIDPDTFNIDPKEVEKKITKKTSAILAVHVFGNPCDMESLERIAKKHKISLIYDAAHAFKVEYKGKSILNWGDASSLSFHAAKTFHTIEGGAVITKHSRDSKEIKLLSNHGIETYDSVIRAGINARINEFEAAMGLCLLKDYEKECKKRKKIYEYYSSEFKQNSKIKLQTLNSDITYFNYPYFPVCFENEKTLKLVLNTLLDNNIRPRRYFYPACHEFPYIKYMGNDLPNSTQISHTVLCLPLYGNLSLGEAKKIVDLVQNKIK